MTTASRSIYDNVLLERVTLKGARRKTRLFPLKSVLHSVLSLKSTLSWPHLLPSWLVMGVTKILQPATGTAFILHEDYFSLNFCAVDSNFSMARVFVKTRSSDHGTAVAICQYDVRSFVLVVNEGLIGKATSHPINPDDRPMI